LIKRFGAKKLKDGARIEGFWATLSKAIPKIVSSLSFGNLKRPTI